MAVTAAGCTPVALESTGIYWRPVYHIFEGSLELALGNARHVKMVPGCKTDVQDAAWLAQPLELGLLRRSYVPPSAPRELRDLVWYRKRVIETRGRDANRLQKTLETAILGVSTRAMLKALIAEAGSPTLRSRSRSSRSPARAGEIA